MYREHETLGPVYQLSQQKYAMERNAEPIIVEHRGQEFVIENARPSLGQRGKVAVVRVREDGGVEKLVFLVNPGALR